MASSVWRGNVNFGLVSFPVKMTTAARPLTISFNQLDPVHKQRVSQKLVDCMGNEVARNQLLKGFEISKDQYVLVDDDEIASIAPESEKVLDIACFVPADSVDSIWLETSYYLQPDTAGGKPYALLYEAMRRQKVCALASLTMHKREHKVLLRPGKHGLRLHTLYYEDEVKSLEEFRTNTSILDKREIDMAVNLVKALSGAFEPETYSDTYRIKLGELLDAKANGRTVAATPKSVRQEAVIDIMDALAASIAKAQPKTQAAPKPASKKRSAAA